MATKQYPIYGYPEQDKSGTETESLFADKELWRDVKANFAGRDLYPARQQLERPLDYDLEAEDQDLIIEPEANESRKFFEELDNSVVEEELREEVLAQLFAEQSEEPQIQKLETFTDKADNQRFEQQTDEEEFREFFGDKEEDQKIIDEDEATHIQDVVDEHEDERSEQFAELRDELEYEFDEKLKDEGFAEVLSDIKREEESGQYRDELDDEEVENEIEEELEDETPTSPSPIKPNREPLAVPPSDPIPFAEPPPIGSYWPVRTARKEGRSLAFQATDSSFVGARGRSRMFLADRKGKRKGKMIPRWHAGIDLFANKGDPVIACEDGIIRNHSYFYPAKSGQITYKLLVEHSKVVVNYGEVTKESLTRNNLTETSRIKAGQVIGFVSDTSMLHFETYTKGTTTSRQWWKDQNKPPMELLNPTKYLLFLQEHGLVSPGPERQPVSSVSSSARGIAALPQRIQDAVHRGLLTSEVALAMFSGERNVDKLTDMMFYAAYPKLRDRKLKRDDPNAQKWLRIRENVIRPALKVMSAVRAPAASSPARNKT